MLNYWWKSSLIAQKCAILSNVLKKMYYYKIVHAYHIFKICYSTWLLNSTAQFDSEEYSTYSCVQNQTRKVNQLINWTALNMKISLAVQIKVPKKVQTLLNFIDIVFSWSKINTFFLREKDFSSTLNVKEKSFDFFVKFFRKTLLTEKISKCVFL